jgi:hypothetical protein
MTQLERFKWLKTVEQNEENYNWFLQIAKARIQEYNEEMEIRQLTFEKDREAAKLEYEANTNANRRKVLKRIIEAPTPKLIVTGSGKDSICVQHLVQELGIKHTVVTANTGMEHQSIIHY